MNMNFEYYKVFYHIHIHGSLTTAAQELCIFQPAISQAAWQLGKEAGTELSFRTSKGVWLTWEGELLYHYIEPGAEELLGGGKILERMLNMDVGEVRIETGDMTLQFYPLPYLRQFHREYPKIRANVTNAPTPEAIKSLEEGKINFGAVTSSFISRGTVRRFQVKAIRNVLIAGSSFRELEGRELGYKGLETSPRIVLEKNTGTRIFVDAFLAQQRVLLKSEFEPAISDMIVQSARRDMGIKCVTEGFVEDAIMRDEVFRLKFKHEMPLRHMYVVTGESSLIFMPGRRLLSMMACGRVAVEQPVGGR